MSTPIDISARPACCETCAFRPGTDANLSFPTQAKVEMCLDLGDPFLCHEPMEGHTGELLCAGFHAEHKRLRAAGEYDDAEEMEARELLRTIAVGMSETVADLVNTREAAGEEAGAVMQCAEAITYCLVKRQALAEAERG